jgi:hypothetical protein
MWNWTGQGGWLRARCGEDYDEAVWWGSGARERGLPRHPASPTPPLPRPFRQPRLRDHQRRVARQDADQHSRGARGAALAALPLANRAERGAGDAREFLLCQAGLEPGRRHKRAIDLDGDLPRPRVGLPLGIGEGVLEPGNEAVKIGLFHRSCS